MSPSVRIIHADCRDAMREMAECSVDAIVTDPPYELNFMGSAWDRSGVAFDGAVWREALRVLKPGAFCLAFAATRTYHRVACAIEDAGFHIREMHVWLHGQGMNKVGYLREADGEAHVRQGWGGSVRPMVEPIVVARKPLSERTLTENVRRWGTGALNVDGCRVETAKPRPGRSNAASASGLTGTGGAATFGAYAVRGSIAVEDTTLGRWPPNVAHDGSQAVLDLFPNTGVNGRPNCSGRRYGRDDATVYGTYDMSDYHGGYLDSGSAARFYPAFPPDDAPARYNPKAAKADRVSRCTGCGWRTMGKTPAACPNCGATGDGTWTGHPTVKPQALMQWLCRLVTPPDGLVLDPFVGSGSTLQAARAEGFHAIGIEQDPESVADCYARLGMTMPTLQATE